MSYRNSLLVAGFIMLSACNDDAESKIPDLNFREEMRQFVQEISTHARQEKNTFLIIPQNGQELFTDDGTGSGEIATEYLAAIDGSGREDLFYGYNADDEATPASVTDDYVALLEILNDAGKTALITDYCSTQSKMDDSYQQNDSRQYVSFAADHRELDNIPNYPASPKNENDLDITSLSNAKNFLYLINPTSFASKTAFLDALKETNYDLVLIDLYFDEEALTASDISSLKKKANGGSRLVICYMSIGEAESYRPYWASLPKKLVTNENPDWPGNYVVKYWEEDWKKIVYKDDNSYTNKILTAGFDGVYLDIIEAYENFE